MENYLKNPLRQVVCMVDAIYAYKKKICILKHKDSKNLLDGKNKFIFKYRHRNRFKYRVEW